MLFARFASLPSGQANPVSALFPTCRCQFRPSIQRGHGIISSAAVSNYNGMVVSFRHQFAGWGNGLFQINYTYGHAFDEVSNGGLFPFTFGSSLYPQDPTIFGAATDRRNTMCGTHSMRTTCGSFP